MRPAARLALIGLAAVVTAAGCNIDDPRFGEAATTTSSSPGSAVGSPSEVSSGAVSQGDRFSAPDRAVPPVRSWELPVGVEQQTAVAVVDQRVVVMRLDGSGDSLVSEEFVDDNVEVAAPALAADGRSVFVEVAYGDAAFSCDRVHRDVFRLDLTGDGTAALVGHGRSPAPSPDGRWLAYLTGSSCLTTDDFRWQAPVDTLVVVDLVRGSERTIRLPVPASADTAELGDVAWDWSGALVFVVGQQIFRVFPDESSIELSDALVAVGDASTDRLSIAGVGPDGVLTYALHSVVDAAESVTVQQLNLATGQLVGELGEFVGPVTVSLDIRGTTVAVTDSEALHTGTLRLVADGQADPAARGRVSGADL